MSSDTQQTQAVSVNDALAIALRLHRNNQLDDAEKLYRRILDAAPELPDALHFLGLLIYQRDKDMEQAESLLRRALALSPDYADAQNNLGNLLKEQDKVDEAAAAYRKTLELNPNQPDAYNNLGTLYRQQGEPEQAIAAYRKAAALDPKLATPWYNLGGVLEGQKKLEEAVEAFRQVLARDRDYLDAYKSLGMALYRLGRKDEAAQVYRDLLEASPNHPVAEHMLAACTGKAVPTRASDAYVTSLFDLFADSFDAQLSLLEYRAPQLIGDALPRRLGPPQGRLDVLDVGCGTGLCGPLLRPYARWLQGMDLSPRMLDKARQRGVYDDLVEAELSEFLRRHGSAYDVIASADTLVYLGALEEPLAAASAAMRPGGLLIFTVERAAPEEAKHGYRIDASGRYIHTADYLRDGLQKVGLRGVEIETVHLRMEHGEPVEGFLVSAHRPRDAGSA